MEENQGKHSKPLKCTLKIGWIRSVYDIFEKYYDFDYNWIRPEIMFAINQFSDIEQSEDLTKMVDCLPNEHLIEFFISRVDWDELQALCDRHSISDAVSLFLFSSLHLQRVVHREAYFKVAFDFDIKRDKPIYIEKRKMYEFLLDNEYEFDDENLAKTQISINYGVKSKITIDNVDNWLYELIKQALHDDLTYDGQEDYDRYEKPQKPNRAPSLGNFIAYNTYLLLKDVVGSQSKFPAEFSRFIIDFCKLCQVEVTERQTTVEGMEDFLKAADRQYKGNPMPYSSIRH